MWRGISVFAVLCAALLVGGSDVSAQTFVDAAEQRLLKLWVDTSRADWVRSTYITGDTEALAAKANERSISAAVAYAKDATKYESAKTDSDTARKLKLLRLSLTLATPHDPD